MRQSTRLFVNTLATYARMIATVGLGLISVRLMIQALGFEDFGILAVLGVSTGFTFLISTTLAQSSVRHMAFEIGRGDQEALSRVFNTVFFGFTGIGLAMTLVTVAIAWPLVHVLNIPAPRTWAAIIFLLCNGISLSIAFASGALRALFIAYQRMVVLEILNVLSSVILVVQPLILLSYHHDRLILLSGLYLVASVLIFAILFILRATQLPHIQLSIRLFHFGEIRRLIGYAGWSFLDQMTWAIRLYLGQLLVNLAQGPIANTAFGLGVQLANYATPLGNALYKTAEPAATTLLGRNDRQNIHRLAVLTCKIQPLLISIFLAPLILDTEFILKIWVGEFPPLTIILAKLLLPWLLVSALTTGIHQARMAHEQIRGYTLIGIVGEAVALVLAAAAIFFFQMPVWVIPMFSLLAATMLCCVRVAVYGRVADLSTRPWIRLVLLPLLGALLPPFVVAALVRELMQPGWIRLLSIFAAYIVLLLPLIWYVALSDWEHAYLKPILAKIASRLRLSRMIKSDSSTITPPR